MEEGLELSKDGKHLEAIAKFKQALLFHGQPSRVLENRIGLAYHFLGEYEQAIVHYSNGIRIKDTSTDRVNRGQVYISINRCDKAITDAMVALALEPEFRRGYHTDAAANYVLAECYFQTEEYLLSLQHMEAAIAIAKEHRYSSDRIALLEENREFIKSYLE